MLLKPILPLFLHQLLGIHCLLLFGVGVSVGGCIPSSCHLHLVVFIVILLICIVLSFIVLSSFIVVSSLPSCYHCLCLCCHLCLSPSSRRLCLCLVVVSLLIVILPIFVISSFIDVLSFIVVSSLPSCCHCCHLHCHLCHLYCRCLLVVIIILSCWCCCLCLVVILSSSSCPTSVAAPASVAAITAAHPLRHHVRLIVIFLHSLPLLPLSTFSIGGHHRIIGAFGVNPRCPQLPLALHRVPRCHCRRRHPLPSTTIFSTLFCNLCFSAGWLLFFLPPPLILQRRRQLSAGASASHCAAISLCTRCTKYKKTVPMSVHFDKSVRIGTLWQKKVYPSVHFYKSVPASKSVQDNCYISYHTVDNKPKITTTTTTTTRGHDMCEISAIGLFIIFINNFGSATNLCLCYTPAKCGR